LTVGARHSEKRDNEKANGGAADGTLPGEQILFHVQEYVDWMDQLHYVTTDYRPSHAMKVTV
ncbi:MAG: hypothetical protein JXA18_16635, partial [Chitinispirillaceae bacterium]|nr:hypothetical protein [Chitinispirillaceae bacterium]